MSWSHTHAPHVGDAKVQVVAAHRDDPVQLAGQVRQQQLLQRPQLVLSRLNIQYVGRIAGGGARQQVLLAGGRQRADAELVGQSVQGDKFFDRCVYFSAVQVLQEEAQGAGGSVGQFHDALG